jgi:diguanylate cyclase (GGDEF)-like protein
LINRDLELANLRQHIAQLTEEARRNEETWKRSQRREMAFLEAENLPELFRHLTTGLRSSFRLQATSVALTDPDHEIRNLLHGQGHKPDGFDDVQLVTALDQLAPGVRRRFRPWLGAFSEREHGSLFAAGGDLASVALLPLIRRAEVVGSLHFGSNDPERFTRRHATDFLHHLASMAAFGLDSAVNRARLVQRQSTDALTGWHNRHYLETRLGEELARSQREQTPLVCLMLDIDFFKLVNDEHGHLAGDAVLRETAQRIGAEVRGSDISARYGGEEFIVLMPQTHLEAGLLLAERIRAAVSGAPFGVDMLDEPLAVTVSIGLAEYRGAGDDAAPHEAAMQLVADADRALYMAKAAGRNVVMMAAA